MNYTELSEYVEIDIKDFTNWLFEYSCRYLEKQKTKITGANIQKGMDRKYLEILGYAREYTEGCDGIESRLEMYWDKLDSVIIADIRKTKAVRKK